jgi:hypothetical protein
MLFDAVGVVNLSDASVLISMRLNWHEGDIFVSVQHIVALSFFPFFAVALTSFRFSVI